ncbi:MAG: Zn-dependent hydrolase [Deltaproteobacteria bacterium]|nr:Zn-dependent hydrolase [Deltaproteobacteria bacterium]
MTSLDPKKTISINKNRLWRRLMEMADIGATKKGGVCRVALTDEDKAGRDLFVRWCREAGCNVTIDEMGNIFSRRAGLNNDLPAVMTGSHLDSQPTGGKFDGVYGVLAGLEVIDTMNDNGITTNRPVDVISWTNEEGARFIPPMVASGVFAGVFDLSYGLSRTDGEGRTIGDELSRIGYAGNHPVGQRPIAAYFELHIEQGPVLEAQEKVVGVVTGVQGMRWYNLCVEGKAAHAGTTPMDRRFDPVMGATVILSALYQLTARFGPHARITFGSFQADPNVVNTVPGRLTISIDLRHPEDEKLKELDTEMRAIVETECSRLGLKGRIDNYWYSPPVAFDPECIDAVRKGVETIGASAMDLISGAGHDAVYISKIAPTGMIFIPCKDGLSHNEAEAITPVHAEAGCNVLLKAMLMTAGITG